MMRILRKTLYRYLLTRHLRDCETFLDVGAGEGLFTDETRKQGKACTAMDISPVRFDTCVMDYVNWSFPVDCVFASQFLEHVDGAKFASWVRWVALKKVIIITPHPYYRFWDDPAHIRPWTPEAVRVLFERESFARVWKFSPPGFGSHVSVFERL